MSAALLGSPVTSLFSNRVCPVCSALPGRLQVANSAASAEKRHPKPTGAGQVNDTTQISQGKKGKLKDGDGEDVALWVVSMRHVIHRPTTTTLAPVVAASSSQASC